MAGNTEESARFKKAFQTVNGGDNNEIVGNTNDEIFKQGQGRNENISSNNDESRPTDSRIEKDLETKGYSTHATDGETDEMKEMRERLNK